MYRIMHCKMLKVITAHYVCYFTKQPGVLWSVVLRLNTEQSHYNWDLN